MTAGVCSFFRARGASMNPTIRDGDILEIAPLYGSDVCVGEVVLLIDESGTPLVHRVLSGSGRQHCVARRRNQGRWTGTPR